MSKSICLVTALLALAPAAWPQNPTDLAAILERIEKLEEQNRALTQEVESLRRQLNGGTPQAATVPERLEVQERRTEELAETKVQASQRLPLSINGMLLFNAFMNSRFNGAADNPTVASAEAVPRTGGATARQTILGLQFHSPVNLLGAQVHGALQMDFFANGTSNSSPTRAISGNLSRLLRLRTATVELDWGDTSFMVGQEKPIFSPRNPTSLAQVGVSPLTNAGNPWLWQPQARLQQRIRFSDRTDVQAQIGVFQTAEASQGAPESLTATLESSRPGLQGRFALRHAFSNDRHIELAPGFHASTTHVAGTSVASRVYSIDWSIAPTAAIDFTGLFFAGENTANLGTLRPGFTVLGPGVARGTHSIGGWTQLAYKLTPRLTFHVYGGQHDDRDRDLRPGGIGKNLAYAGNALYQIAPNILLGLEWMQVRTTYIGAGRRLNNHYDLALAYQF